MQLQMPPKTLENPLSWWMRADVSLRAELLFPKI
jgi:hypothetical protein